MKVFHCDHCRQLLFFENTQCVKCGHALAYIPDLGRVAALEPEGDLWRVAAVQAAIGSAEPNERRFRLCDNYAKENVCNWALPADSALQLCESCSLTRVIPDLEAPGGRGAWFKLEAAKRRLIYTLKALGCPISSKADDPQRGLAYEFLAPDGNSGPVLTGHADGVITVNVAEADDANREKQRARLHEPYRTLLGHFRHESGHYYWQHFVDGQPRIEAFRSLFGDERADYAAALQRHYDSGPPPDWQENFVSAYAASHPWEDWAESWAHYLHMTDVLETAAATGLQLKPAGRDEPALVKARSGPDQPFEQMLQSWYPLTYVLNNLNRGMGLADGYPFVLSAPAVEKLRFVHETIAEQAGHP